MKYGYARVSTADQSLDVQLADLKAAGCDVIRSEKATGTRTDGRPELAALLDFIRADDELVVCRLDRLARSTFDLCRIVRTLEEKGARLRAVHQPIDTGSPTGRLLVQMLAVIAEFETAIRAERQREGIAAARAAGRYAGKGRPPSIDPDQVGALLASTGSASAVARKLKISRASVYRLAGLQEGDLPGLGGPPVSEMGAP